MASEFERSSIAAHWMLGRLSIIQGVLVRLQRDPDLDAEMEQVLLDRARSASSELQSALEDIARGVPPLWTMLDRPSFESQQDEAPR